MLCRYLYFLCYLSSRKGKGSPRNIRRKSKRIKEETTGNIQIRTTKATQTHRHILKFNYMESILCVNLNESSEKERK